VHEVAALHTQACLHGSRRIVEAAVGDLAVARRRLLAKASVTLQQQNVATVAHTCVRAGQSNNTAADDGRLKVHCQSTIPASDFKL
jgi:hypothetical protein